LGDEITPPERFLFSRALILIFLFSSGLDPLGVV